MSTVYSWRKLSDAGLWDEIGFVNLRNLNQPIKQARLCKKKSGFEKLFFSIRPERWNGMNPSRGIEGVKPGTEKKKTILGDLNFFFGTALVKLSDKPGFAKKTMFQGSKKLFFRMPLVKSANSTSLPRFSSLQIAQLHTIHN